MLAAGVSHACTRLFSAGLSACTGLSMSLVGTAVYLGERGSAGPVTCVCLPIPPRAVGYGKKENVEGSSVHCFQQ